jgi:hypothetical protein
MTYIVTIKRSDRKNKKFVAIINEKEKVHFGGSGYADFTVHKDEKKRKHYIARHKGLKENWGVTGIKTAGFWSRWLLWNKESLEDSRKDIEKKFPRVNILFRM